MPGASGSPGPQGLPGQPGIPADVRQAIPTDGTEDDVVFPPGVASKTPKAGTDTPTPKADTDTPTPKAGTDTPVPVPVAASDDAGMRITLGLLLALILTGVTAMCVVIYRRWKRDDSESFVDGSANE